MNYEKIYQLIIQRALVRQRSTYTPYEKHHIIPRCVGGSNSPDNLVYLTPEEHFVCHQLLAKGNPTHSGLLFAVIRMTGGGNGRGLIRSNKAYAWVRRRISAYQKERLSALGDNHWMRDPLVAKKVSLKMRGVPKPWMRGESNPAKTPAFREATSGEKNPAKREDVRAKISKALRIDRGRPFRCLETGKVFQTLEEARSWLVASGAVAAQRPSILKVLQKKNKHAYGFTFEYLP
jgi:hypothetical protein